MGGGVFCKEVENVGCFFVKMVENVFFCKKSGKGGCFVKVDLSSTLGALGTVSVFFYFTFHLFGECVRIPPAYGTVTSITSLTTATLSCICTTVMFPMPMLSK